MGAYRRSIEEKSRLTKCDRSPTASASRIKLAQANAKVVKLQLRLDEAESKQAVMTATLAMAQSDRAYHSLCRAWTQQTLTSDRNSRADRSTAYRGSRKFAQRIVDREEYTAVAIVHERASAQ